MHLLTHLLIFHFSEILSSSSWRKLVSHFFTWKTSRLRLSVFYFQPALKVTLLIHKQPTSWCPFFFLFQWYKRHLVQIARWVDVTCQWLLCGFNTLRLPCTSTTSLLCTVSFKDLLAKKLRTVFFLLCISVPPSSVQNKLQACNVTPLFKGCCLLKKPRHTSGLHLRKINKLLGKQWNVFVLMINKKLNALNTD